MLIFYDKYLKYKKKYIELKKSQYGGAMIKLNLNLDNIEQEIVTMYNSPNIANGEALKFFLWTYKKYECKKNVKLCIIDRNNNTHKSTYNITKIYFEEKDGIKTYYYDQYIQIRNLYSSIHGKTYRLSDSVGEPYLFERNIDTEIFNFFDIDVVIYGNHIHYDVYFTDGINDKFIFINKNKDDSRIRPIEKNLADDCWLLRHPKDLYIIYDKKFYHKIDIIPTNNWCYLVAPIIALILIDYTNCYNDFLLIKANSSRSAQEFQGAHQGAHQGAQSFQEFLDAQSYQELLSSQDNQGAQGFQGAHQDARQDAHQDARQDAHQDAHQDARQDAHQDAH